MTKPSEPQDSQFIPALLLWQHIGPADSLCDIDREDLLSALRIAAQTDDRPEIINIVELATAGDVGAMIALGAHYAKAAGPRQIGFNRCIGWLLLAAPHSAKARFLVGWFLSLWASLLHRRLRRGDADRSIRPLIRKLDERAEQWLRETIVEFDSPNTLVKDVPTIESMLPGYDPSNSNSDRKRFRRQLFQSNRDPAGGPVADPVQREPSTASAGYTMRVLDSIAPANGDGHLQAIVEQFARLEGPVPTTPLGDVAKLVADLHAEFPWAGSAIERIDADLSLARYVGAPFFTLRPLLLVGSPGSGKSRFARRLAELAGAAFGTISAAGSTDNRALAGTARGWGNTCPSLVLSLIESAFLANPVLLVDEVDKATSTTAIGRILDTLLLLLESETAARWFDECLMTRANLSAVTWIATANDASGLSGPLRSRFTLVPFDTPRDQDFPSIARAVRIELAEDYRCDPMALPDLSPEIMESLRAEFMRRRDVRAIRRLMVAAMAAATRRPPVTH